MRDLVPWKTGAALALTIAAGYSACALLFVLWPGPAMDLVGAMFHGLDFRKLQTTTPWSTAAFAYALVALAIWGFAIGALFAWLHNVFYGNSPNG